MGGPFWARKDAGAWSIPKGEYQTDETAEAAARREFREELGLPAPMGELIELGTVKQSGGKVVTAWALEGDLDPDRMAPGTFELEWPKGSGQVSEFPEIDRVEWFEAAQADEKIVAAQRTFLERLVERLDT
jgi:predicted NUDIX family NTP pyrophosphohydrolase